jgi:hypothetical protein
MQKYTFEVDRIEHGHVEIEAENEQKAREQAEQEYDESEGENFHFDDLETVFLSDKPSDHVERARIVQEMTAVSDILEVMEQKDLYTQSDLQGRLQAIVHTAIINSVIN